MPYDTPTARFVGFGSGSSPTEAAEDAQPITLLTAEAPSASAPTEGLPGDAKVGRFYQFQSRPTTIYTIGPDGVWRAILLVSVV